MALLRARWNRAWLPTFWEDRCTRTAFKWTPIVSSQPCPRRRSATVHCFRYGEVVGLQRTGERVTGVLLKDGATIACETLVLAMGAWTGVALAQWLGLMVPIGPYPLQKLHVRPAGPMPRCAVRW